MGFGDVSVESPQMAGSLGSARVEFGDWSRTGSSTTQEVPTTFTRLIGGLMIGHANTCGRAVEIADGNIDFTIGDATDGPLSYIAFGW